MGRYPGRRIFLSLPPEAAHRLAGTLLGLPLPWERLGGAALDPRLGVSIAGIALRNPIGLAAGFDKRCAHLDALGRLGFGYLVGGTITRHSRYGNPKPRIARYPERRSMANSMGLPNPGAEAAVRNLAERPATAPRFVSLADQDPQDAFVALGLLAPFADAIELNASCPNVSWGRDRDGEGHLTELVKGFRARTDKPIFVKLPPFTTDVEREVVLALARVAQEAGASGLTCSNTRPVREPRLRVGEGGLSGRELFARTPAIVAEVRAATGGALAINACGGVSTAAEALACLEAGATTVQVYTALVYQGPGLIGDLTAGLSRALRDRGTDVPAFVGSA
ncbi:MAG: dihydroorotate dehydrogenase 2 [Actinobacteria bacterium]|nr:dihydroorotate dehydrogenase 2 [Actinomycetota bacterium]